MRAVLAILGLGAASLAAAAPTSYRLDCANGSVEFVADAPIEAFQAFTPQAGSLLYLDAVERITVDPTAPFGALVQATTADGTRFAWIFPDRRLKKTQRTAFGREATLTVGPGRKGIQLVASSPVDVSASVAFSPSRTKVLPWVVGTALVGLVAYDLSRPSPRPSSVPEPASLACIGVGVLGLARRRRFRS